MRVLCVDDSADICEMVGRLMRGLVDLESVGRLENTVGIVDEVVRLRAGVVILDLTIPPPGPTPLEAIRLLSVHVPLCRVIAYSGYDDADTRAKAMHAGAWDLVSKHGEPADIIAAIRRVAALKARTTGKSHNSKL